MTPEQAVPAGWERMPAQFRPIWAAELPENCGRVYVDPSRPEVEFGLEDTFRLSPADARAFAARLVEAADLAESKPPPL